MDKRFSPNRSLDFKSIKSIADNRINELRIMSGLAHHDFKERKTSGVSVLKSPDRLPITSECVSGDFVRINLNGGDSWAYYYYLKNPEIVFNFKGEPNLSLRDINPSYYKGAKKKAQSEVRKERLVNEKSATLERHNESKQNGTRFYVAFRDEKTDIYYVGYHDFATGQNFFGAISSKDKINDYLQQHGVYETPEIIETWNYQFDPSNLNNFDYLSGVVNSFEPSEYLKNASKLRSASIPPSIEATIRHALGPDNATFDHFINWLAYIFQHRNCSQTAWVLQGQSGTGKGILYNQIIRPLLGDKQCLKLTLENFEEQFNKSLETCLFAFFDEVDTDQMRNRDKVVAKLKTSITEPTIGIRCMRQDYREAPNHLNIMMASNRHNSMRIEDNDRRFNVCQRQEKKLKDSHPNIPLLIAKIHSELSDFADYLYSYVVDEEKARTPLENQAKKLLADTTQTSIEAVATALLQGDLKFLIEHRPDKKSLSTCKFDDDPFFHPGDKYYEVLTNAIRNATHNKFHVLTHADLFALFELLVGKIPSGKIRLTKFVGHQGIVIDAHTTNGKSTRGYKLKWSASNHELNQWHQELLREEDANKPKPLDKGLKDTIAHLSDANTKS